MRRSRVTRVTTALYAVWFAFAFVVQANAHACPMQHGRMVASGDMVTSATHTQSGPHAEHANDVDVRGTTSNCTGDHNGHDHGKHTCSCVTCYCCAPIVVLVPPHRSLGPANALTYSERPAQFADVHVPDPRSEHLLPFPNGPPGATIVAL